MGKEKLIPIFAILVLLIGSLSTIYTYAVQLESDFIEINGEDYTIEDLFSLGKEKSFEDFSGVSLEDIIVNIGIENPKNHEYNIIGSDGYQKTVKWENIENGFLTRDKQTIFSDLPKAFRVKDIVKIEVK